MSTHSPIGASSAERFWNCPGSVKLIERVPAQKDTIYSATGTVAHAVAERWLKSGDRSNRFILRETGKSYVQGDFEIEVTEDMAEAVELYVNTIWETLDKHGLSLSDLKTEVRFHLKHLDNEAFGTCDASIVVPCNVLYIFDYKHGQGYAVEVEENKQLMMYALGAYYALSERERDDLVYVELVIVQPRARHTDGSVRRHRIDLESLLEFEHGLRDAIIRVRATDSTLRIGAWCKFCAAKALCPAKREEVGQLAGVHFSAVETAPLTLPPPASMTPERLGQLLKNADVLEDWTKAVRNYTIAVAATGQDVSGYKFVEKYGNRRWKDEAKVVEKYSDEFGNDLYNMKLRTPAQMEKLLGKKRATEITELWEKPITGTTLVPEDDARVAVQTVAMEHFSPVDDF